MRAPLVSAAAAYMYEGTSLWGRLGEARRLIEEVLDSDALYQVRESARITYYRHIVPVATEPLKDVIEDALPLFIMYVSNAAEEALRAGDKLRPRLPHAVYSALRGFLREKREPQGSPISRALSFLEEAETAGKHVEDIGAYYSLFFAVVVVVQAYASGMPVMRLSLAPLYGLAKSSLQRLNPTG